jgi:hypothetical protein
MSNNIHVLWPDIGVAHQRIIREKKEKEIGSQINLFNDITPENTDIKRAIVRPVSKETAEKIILEYEYLGKMANTYYHFGIYFGNWCAGVTCFGSFNAPMGYGNFVGDKYKDKGIQLSRGACVYWAHEHSASKLISGSLRILNNLGYKYVVAFSDPEAGEIGTVYQATNWHYLGFGKTYGKCHLYNKNSNKKIMDYRDFPRGGNSLEIEFTENIFYNDDLELRPVKPKGRYVYLLGTKKEKKEMMCVLKKHIQPYPKREK